ncbi:hypothetical protein OYC64_008526 [Pagothenia borchgrevinki]|uniref:Uncharacterized protein n=1 Tax=Pagothenia borchgrevinki TaxID=8213 RepID=A0ABD2G5S0_PAGBO
MAPIMEGTHTVLLLYAPICELSNISLYFPKRLAPNFKYKSRASHSGRACNDHDRAKEDLAVSEQRGQSFQLLRRTPHLPAGYKGGGCRALLAGGRAPSVAGRSLIAV